MLRLAFRTPYGKMIVGGRISPFNGWVLNYMSIACALQTAIGARRLDYLRVDGSDPVERVMLVSQEVQELLAVGGVHASRISLLLADLQAFVRGDVVSLCFRPRDHGDAYLGRLEPVESGVWDVRCRKPAPAMRVLGRFVRADVFVALDWWPRSVKVAWSDKEPLLDDQRWDDVIAQCATKWDEILPGIRPVVSMEVGRHVTGNFDLC